MSNQWMQDKMLEIQNNCTACGGHYLENHFFLSWLKREFEEFHEDGVVFQNLCCNCFNKLFSLMLRMVATDEENGGKEALISYIRRIKPSSKPVQTVPILESLKGH